MEILPFVTAEFKKKFVFMNPMTSAIRARIIELLNTPGFVDTNRAAEEFVCAHPHGSLELWSAQQEAI